MHSYNLYTCLHHRSLPLQCFLILGNNSRDRTASMVIVLSCVGTHAHIYAVNSYSRITDGDNSN